MGYGPKSFENSDCRIMEIYQLDAVNRRNNEAKHDEIWLPVLNYAEEKEQG